MAEENDPVPVPVPDPDPVPVPEPSDPTPPADPPEPPHAEEVPEWGRNLIASVEGLASQVEGLVTKGVDPEDVTDPLPDDEAPAKPPWTHRKFL